MTILKLALNHLGSLLNCRAYLPQRGCGLQAKALFGLSRPRSLEQFESFAYPIQATDYSCRPANCRTALKLHTLRTALRFHPALQRRPESEGVKKMQEFGVDVRPIRRAHNGGNFHRSAFGDGSGNSRHCWTNPTGQELPGCGAKS